MSYLSWLAEHLVRVRLSRVSDAEHDVLKREPKHGQLAVADRRGPGITAGVHGGGIAASKNRLSDIAHSGAGCSDKDRLESVVMLRFQTQRRLPAGRRPAR